MYEPLLEIGAETVALAAYAIGTIALSILGLAAEYNSLQQFGGGDLVLAVWFAFMGAIALAFAVNLGREKLYSQL